MKLFKYNQFITEVPLNENLDKAKKLMKDNFLLQSAAQDLGFIEGELKAQLDHKEKRAVTLNDFTPEQQAEIKAKLRDLKLTDEQVRSIERNPDFLKIREYLGQKYIGWVYPFTYFYFVEMIPMEDLFTKVNPDTKQPESILSKLIEYSGLLDKLPKKFDHNFIDPSITNNCEKLVDGLDSLEDYKKIKKVIDQLTPPQKKDYLASPEVIKNQFTEVARAFNSLGGDDKEKHERLWKGFFGELKTIEEDTVIHGKSYKKGDKRYFGQLYRYKNIREFIKAAQNYLKSCGNETIIEFYEKINQCNEKYGLAGADVIFDENGILIIEVKSFVANVFLNGHTRHCIKDYESQWSSYVSSHYNKQYYIYNFNIPQYDNFSTIGITIEPGQRIRACHAKDDANISSRIKSILSGWNKEYGIETELWDELKPMTPEEIAKREKAKIAEREIVKKGITIDQINKYVKEDGADINKDRCVALANAVEENDYEKTKVIIELGGNANLRTRSEAIINKAKTLDMIKLLVANGSELTPEVYKNIGHDFEAVKYCLEQGLDANFENGLPARNAIIGTYKNREDMGKGYFDVFKLLIDNGAKFGIDQDRRNVVVKFAAEYNRLDFLDYIIEKGCRTGFKNALERWLRHSAKQTPEVKEKIVKYLEDKIEKYEKD